MKRDTKIKERLKVGLEELIQSTVPDEDNYQDDYPRPKKREHIKRCNFLIDSGYHTKLKIVAAEKNISMVEALKEALNLYFSTFND